MTQTEIIILNFEEVRRRSLKLWSCITPEIYSWKPDGKAESFMEVVRHILECEHRFHTIIERRGNIAGFVSPWAKRPYTTVDDEIEFAKPFRHNFLEAIKNFTPEELRTIEIIRAEVNQRRKLGDYLLRAAYHESVHTGQLLSYLRTVGVDRPKIWD
jgi:uncharacterized damage-inducible protein DinB